jgi:glycosyltransferase involved in cell wall biosynthesis
MKLLILTSYFNPDLCAGSFRSSSLVDAIERNKSEKIELKVITTLPNRYEKYSVQASAFEDHGWMQIFRIKIPKHSSGAFKQALAFLWYSYQAVKIAKDNDFDLVFATSSRFLTAYIGFIIAKRQKTKLYLDIRDLFTETLVQVKGGFFLRLISSLIRLLEKKMFAYACEINVVSPAFVDYVKESNSSSKITQFTNGIDAEFENFDFTQIFKKKYTSIIYAGNIGEGQALHKILPCVAERLIGEAEIVVVGSGGKDQLLRKIVEERGINNIKILAPVARQELIKIYREADILFLHLDKLPAFDKVLPSKLFEYAQTGKPILAGVMGLPKKFLDSEVDGSFTFEPNCLKSFLVAYDKLKSEQKYFSRSEFCLKYSRTEIMNNMAIAIIKSASNSSIDSNQEIDGAGF